MEPTPYRNEDLVMPVALIANPAAILAKSSGITLDPIAKPIAAVLAFFYGLVPNYGVAIILLTVAVMVILTPLTIKQTRSMLVMQKLQPQLKRLQEEHKNDRAALNEAVMALYKEHNASPLGGCLPMLLPFPVFFALFRVLEGLSRKIKGKSMPKYLKSSTLMYKHIQADGGSLKAFGMDLSKSADSVKGSFLTTLPFFVLLVIMVGTQYYQQRQLTSRNPQAAMGQQAQIMKFFPIIFGVLSIRFPAGVVVYWTMSNVIRIFQQWAMYRYDPKVKALVEQDVKEVEAKTREIDDAKPSRPRLRDILTGGSTSANLDSKTNNRPGGRNAGGKPGGKATPPVGKAGSAAKSGSTSKTPSPKATPSNSKSGSSNGKAPPSSGKPSATPAKSTPTTAKTTSSNGKGPKPVPSSSSGLKAVPPPAKVPQPDTTAETSNGVVTPLVSTETDAGTGTGGAPSTGVPRPRTSPGSSGRTGGTGARSAGNRSRRTRRGR
jgi:YidC/Oxa1 family membrane protein insertase